MIGIYKITSPSGRVYIGQSIQIDKRKNQYEKGNGKKQPRLYASIMKYGFSAHIFEVIELCIVEELDVRERYWQEFYNVLSEGGLNSVLTATGVLRAKRRPVSEDTRRRMSQAALNMSLEKKKIQAESKKGRKMPGHSKETRDKISQANKGKVYTEEQCRLKSLNHSRRGRVYTEEERLVIYGSRRKKKKL